METILFEKIPGELRKNLKLLSEKLNVSLSIQGKRINIEGEAIDEYEAILILDAMRLGFSAKKALQLKDDGIMFVKIPIKHFTRRKDLREVRARIIGKNGKTKRTMESVADCDIAISGNEVGIIGYAESIEETKTAITNLIRGTKEANVYSFLEKANTQRKKRISKTFK